MNVSQNRIHSSVRRALNRKAPRPMALEARLMFDGAAVDTTAAVAAADHHPGPAEVVAASAVPSVAPAAVDIPSEPIAPPPPEAPTSAPALADARTTTAVSDSAPRADTGPRTDAAPSTDNASHTDDSISARLVKESTAGTEDRHEIVFVDSALTNWQSLVDQAKPEVEVVLIDSRGDGLAQMADYLQDRNDVDAIHILAHAEDGVLDLGTTRLDSSALQSQDITSALQSIGSHLSADGDILLYGCDLARTSSGEQLITQIAEITSADIAASIDSTGSESLGGDWTLEAQTGHIEARALNFDDPNKPAFLLGVPTVSSVDDTTYTEGSGAVVVDSNITITGGTSYDGKYVRFSLTNGQTTDILSLINAPNVNVSGAISFVGATVYVGNGSSRDAIGTIDSTENGLNGQALRINFVSTFTNSSFETSPLTGWTPINGVINLGVTNIAGFTSPNDPTNPGNSGGNDNDYPSTPGTFTTTLDTAQHTDGNQSLRLLSSGMTTANGYDVVHGPAVYSDVFAATAGDAIYFDWRAFAGADAYDVYGYLLNTATGATTEVLNSTGASTGASTAWATASAAIPTTGNYRFVFVSGTYDYSGGRAAGASLYIDNVRVFGSKVNDAIVTAIARQVAFNATSDAPITSSTRVFTVTAASSSGGFGSDTGLINITATNDAPTLTGTAQVLNYTENAAATPVDTVVVVADPDLPANFNGGYLDAQITSNGAAEDQLSVLNQGTGAGQIGVSGSNVTYGGVIIGVIDGTLNGANNTALRIALNANATAAATQALARVISYRDTSDAPSTLIRTLTLTLNDGGNSGTGTALSTTRTATINVAAVDDPSLLTLSNSAANYTENDSSFFVDPNLTITDVDTTTMNGAKVIIASGFRNTEDQLLPASGTNSDGITYSYDATKGVLTLSGTATIAQYQAALRAVKYNNTSDNPDIAGRTITFTLGNAVALTINGVNHYYEAVSGPLSWTAARTAAEGRSFQGLTGYLATITSQAENDFIRTKLTADAWIGASDDYLFINAATGVTTYASQAASEGHWYWVTGPESGSRISDGNTNPVTFSGSYAYWNSSEPNNAGNEHYGEIYSTGASPGRWNDLPNSVSLAYVVEYSDSGGTPSFSKSTVITPVRVNDAPVASGSVTLTSITEDATSSAGQLVSSFLSATDPDTDPVTGIAITTLSSSRGTWQYSLDNGASWVNVGAVSSNSALLLRTTDRVRFIPDALNADSASLTYKAWDRTNENTTTIKAGVKVDVSSNGGITAYSTGNQTASLAVTAINDAPTQDAATPSLTGVSEDDTSNVGNTISSVLGATVHDADTGAQQGVAITSLSSGNGTWEYSTNSGSSWTAVGAVAVNSALLLRDTDLVRFRPDGRNGTTATFSYRAWDRSTGTQGTKVDTTVSGGITAFSVASNVASILVASINDAPVLTGAALAFAGISEDDTNGAGQTVASVLAGTLTDVDLSAVQGIAITGKSEPGTGHWEFDNGGGWTTLGSVSPNAAVLLRATDRLRFIPDQQHGGTASLTIRGWDTTTGTSGSTADTTVNGGTTAFSSVSATASLAVSEINDPPLFVTPASASLYTEMDGATAVGANLVLTDDGSSLKSASVRISANFTAGDVLAVGTPGGLTVAYNASSGVLSLSGTASVATYQAALRSVTFRSTSDDPTSNGATRSLEWLATDTANALSIASVSTLTVVPTADAPAISSTPPTWTYTEDDGTRVIAPKFVLSDADDGFLSGATVTISGTGYLTDGTETLSATIAGTSISASFDATTGVLTLSGADSVENYQRVLRSVTYTNTADYNNPGNPGGSVTLDGTTNTRNIDWQVTDANSDGAAGSPAYGAQPSNLASTTVTIQNANETPQVNNITGNTTHIVYTEGGVPATLEGQVSVIDDSTFGGSTSISGAFVRVTTGLEESDLLGLFDSAALATAGWTQVGSATSGTLVRSSDGSTEISYVWSSDNGEITFQTTVGNATQTDYTDVMQHVGFQSTSDDPTVTAGSRTLIWRVVDSFGEQSAVTSAQSTIIDIEAINDTASVNNASLPANGDVAYSENGPVVTLASALTLADPDDTTLTQATVTISGPGFIAANEYLSVPGATVSAGSDWALTNVSGSGIDASYDFASGTLTLSGAKTLAAYQTVLRQVAYGSVDNDPTATATTRTISWTLTDTFASRLTDVDGGANDSDTGSAGATRTSTVTLIPSNDAPSLSGLGGAVGYTEGGSAAVLAPPVAISDLDDVNFSQAQVSISAGFTVGDTLSVGSAGGLSVSYNSTTGILTLSGTASRAVYETALQSVGFTSSSSNPTAIAPSRTISWQITDADASGDGVLTSAIGNTTVDITSSDNAAAVGGLPSNGVITYVENGSLAAVAPALTLTDPDDTLLAGATVAITSGATGGDLLALAASLSGTGISVDPASTATSLVLTGLASVADYQDILRSVTFASTNENPTSGGATRTLTWTTTSAFSSRLSDAVAGNDAASGATSVGVTSQVTLTALNDPPSIAFDDGTPADTTDAPVFQQGSPPIFVIHSSTPNTAGGVTVADIDDSQLSGATVQITDSYSTDDVLSIATPGGWSRVGNVYSIGGDNITVTYNGSNGTLTLSGTASTANYQTLLGNVQFLNATSAPTATGASRELTWTISDANSAGNGAQTSTGVTHLVIRDINDSPTILPTSATANYAEGDLSVSLPDIVVTDADPGEIVTATLTLSSTSVGQLTAPSGSLYDVSTGVWTTTGTVSDVNAALAAVAFIPATDNDLNATIAVNVADGGEDSATAATGTISLNVTGSNDAPVLVPASPVLSPITEDDVANAGYQVGAFRGVITDVDSGTQPGIAISDLTSGNGTWQFSVDGGVTWSAVGSVSATNALLLRDTDWIRFVPNGQNATAADFTYRAWDGTVGAFGTTINASTVGNSAPFSSAFDVASLNVSAVNDAPVLADADTLLPDLTEDETQNTGHLVSDLLNNNASDVDSGAQFGMAITGLNPGNGRWQYSLDGGSTWTDVTNAAPQTALLLRDTDRVRFVPDATNATAVSLNYRAWDQTVGAAGGVEDATATSAFSIEENAVLLNVTDLNDVPVLVPGVPDLTTITEDATDNLGDTVADILGPESTDPDTGALTGIAIISTSNGNGTWQYSLNNGVSWTTIAPLASDTGLLLRDTDRVRFLPDGQNATSATFVFRSWDRSVGAAGNVVSTVLVGPTGAFSDAFDTASIVVSAVNDAPVLATDTPVFTTIDEDAQNEAGLQVSTMLGSTVSDVDIGAIQGIAITELNPGNGSWQYSLDAGATWLNVDQAAIDNALLLRATDYVRFRPDAQNATQASFNYRAWDQALGLAGERADATVAGTTTSFSDLINTASITVTAVNDAPINDVAPTHSGARRVDDTLRQDGVLTVDPQLWHDVDTGDPAVSFRYQWEIADDANGTNLRTIDGATAATYTVLPSEIGKYIRVKVFGGDGQVETVAVSTFSRVSNQEPVANQVLVTQQTTESVPLNFTIPADAFIDADKEDTLYYSATLADGTPLPAWLTFDPQTRTFTGTPGGGDVAVLSVRVTASDHGLNAASSTFTLRVLSLPVNLPDILGPTVDTTVPIARNIDVSTPITTTTEAPFLQTSQVQVLSVSSIGATDVTTDAVKLTSTEPFVGMTQGAGFQIPVDPSASNKVELLLINPLADQYTQSATEIRFAVPPDTFLHTQKDAVITLTASRLDGTPLPSWLRFDAVKGEFQGDVPPGFSGDIAIRVTAHDDKGNEVTTIFRFRVKKSADRLSLSGRSGLSAQLSAHYSERALPRVAARG